MRLKLTRKPGAAGSTPESMMAIIVPRPSSSGLFDKNERMPVSRFGVKHPSGKGSIQKQLPNNSGEMDDVQLQLGLMPMKISYQYHSRFSHVYDLTIDRMFNEVMGYEASSKKNTLNRSAFTFTFQIAIKFTDCC